MKLHHIHLSGKDRQAIDTLLNSGSHPARVIRRAHILLKADSGLKDAEIATHLDCTTVHVAIVRQRYCTNGLERALFDAPRSGKPPTFTGTHEALIVALACTEAPEGRARWTMQLLAERAVDDGIVQQISPQSVWLMLERQNTKPWLKKNVVHSETNPGVQGTNGGHPHAVSKTIRSSGTGVVSR
jgi:transposase